MEYRNGERGVAVVDFVLVSMVFIPLIAGLVQFGLFLHVRNTMTACAHEGARVAASYQNTLEEGLTRTGGCIEAALHPRFAQHITSGVAGSADQPVVYMQAAASMPAFGFFGPGAVDFTVRGHAVNEPDAP